MNVSISISVGGLWFVRADVPEDTTWSHLQEVIYRETGVFKDYQRISSPSRPDVFYDGPLHFEEGDEVAFRYLSSQWSFLLKNFHAAFMTICLPGFNITGPAILQSRQFLDHRCGMLALAA